MGGDEAEGPMRVAVPEQTLGSGGGQGLVGRRERRHRAHEYWNARPWSVRQEDRGTAPAPLRPPLAVAPRPEGPFELTSAGLPMRVAPALAAPDQAPLAPALVAVPDVVDEAVPVVASAVSGDSVDEALEMLLSLAPHLRCLADDRVAEGRITFARCHELLARMGRSVSDRGTWRALIRLCDADPDAEVRRAADEALEALETYGTLPRL